MQAGQIAASLASLAAILALIVLAGRVARTRLLSQGRNARATAALRLRASLALDTRRRLHLVETDAGAVLVLTGGTRDQLLAWPSQNGVP